MKTNWKEKWKINEQRENEQKDENLLEATSRMCEQGGYWVKINNNWILNAIIVASIHRKLNSRQAANREERNEKQKKRKWNIPKPEHCF